MKKLKIFFVQPINNETLAMDMLGQQSRAFGYLKAYLDKYLDFKDIEYKVIQNVNELEKEKCDILAVSAYSQYFYHANKIIEKARELYPDLFIILGGHHITLVPSSLPDEVDAGVIGEGEETFLDLISLYLKKSSVKELKKELHNIKGIIFKDNESPKGAPVSINSGASPGPKKLGFTPTGYYDTNKKLVMTEPRPLIEPLDKIPFFDKMLSSSWKIDMDIRQTKIYNYIFASRGCPFNCSFCSAKITSNGRYREFSTTYIINEIEQILEILPDVTDIIISDETFGSNKKRLQQIIEQAEKKQINKKLSFNASIRSDLVDEEFCELLKRLNVKTVLIGAESMSARILNLLKQGVTPQDNERACKLLTKYGIESSYSMIFGTPSETEEDLKLSFDFILNNIRSGDLSSVCIAILTPLPGTYWWTYAKEQGWVDENNMNWTKLDNIFMSCIPSGVKTYQEWRDERENYAIYLNKYTIPERRFYDLLGQFNKKFTDAMFSKARWKGQDSI